MTDDTSQAGDAPEPRGRVVGKKPTPRTLLITDDDALAAKFQPLFPTCERVGATWERREQEYDLVVTTKEVVVESQGRAREPATHLFMVSFGINSLGSILESTNEGTATQRIHFTGTSNAREYRIPPIEDPALRRLIETDLLPAVEARTDRHPTVATGRPGRVPAQPLSRLKSVVPLLKATDGAVLAALFSRRPDGALSLALPADVKDYVGWVKAALHIFRREAPQRFQRIPGWEELSEWSTAEEARLRVEIADLESQRSRVLHDFHVQEDGLRRELAAASVAAESGLRRLLTAQHDALPDAVAEALDKLGFAAKLMDSTHDPHNKLEDLRVTDPQGDDNWEALVEVRGYKGGASLNDLLRLQRFAFAYERETGRPPSAVWYIVNQLAGQDPAERQPVLASQQSDLEEWANAHSGMAMDTASLFRLLGDVEAGRLDPQEARSLLREASVRFDYPTPPHR